MSKPTKNEHSASRHPAKTAKPPIKRPAEFQPSHVERQRDRAWSERDNPDLSERKTHGSDGFVGVPKK
jgi:hypothetical protein